MCGGGIGQLLSIALPAIATIAAPEIFGPLTALESAGVGAAAGAGGGLLSGGGLKGALEGGALGGFGGYLGGGGASQITNGLGITTNGISDLNPFSGASDGLTNFADNSGLSQLFGGTPQPAGNLTDAFNSMNSVAPDLETAAGAAAPLANAPTAQAAGTFLPSGGTGAGSLAGGASGGGFDLPSAGASEASALPSSSGIGTGLSGDFSQGIFNPGADASVGSNVGGFSIPGVSNTLSTGGSNVAAGSGGLFGGGSNQMIGGLLKGALGQLMSNNNNKGYNAQMNAGQQVVGDYQPFMQAGQQAQGTLADLLGLNGANPGAQAAAQANWQNTPGYQFQLNQGMNAVNADAAAKGQVLSGNNQRAIQDYGSGLANQTYNNYLGNLQNQIGTGLQGAGGVATGQAGIANAQMGKSGQAANTQNTGLAQMLSALFPQNGISFGSNGLNFNNANNGILSLFG